MTEIYMVVGFAFTWLAFALLSSVAVILVWFFFLAPMQRSIFTYIFMTRNKEIRHESLDGLGETEILIKVVKSNFKDIFQGNTSATGSGFGYRVNILGLIKIWKDE